MKKETKTTGKVTLKRINNSVNGNPKYQVLFSNDTSILSGKTASDYNFCYSLPYSCNNKNAIVEYHITATGRVVFTNIQLVEDKSND